MHSCARIVWCFVVVGVSVRAWCVSTIVLPVLCLTSEMCKVDDVEGSFRSGVRDSRVCPFCRSFVFFSVVLCEPLGVPSQCSPPRSLGFPTPLPGAPHPAPRGSPPRSLGFPTPLPGVPHPAPRGSPPCSPPCSPGFPTPLPGVPHPAPRGSPPRSPLSSLRGGRCSLSAPKPRENIVIAMKMCSVVR